MDNQILILIKIITLLYLNDQTADKDSSVFDEVQDLVDAVKIDTKALNALGGEEAVTEALLNTARWMLFNREGGYEREDLVQRLSINMQCNHDYIDIAKKALDDSSAMDEDKIKKRMRCISKELKHEKNQADLKKLIVAASARVCFSNERLPTTYIRDLALQLENLSEAAVADARDQNLVGRVDFSDPENIKKALMKGVDRITPKGILNTGFIGMNDACGGFGIKRGELVNYGALTHHYKSGILTDLSLNVPYFNKPWMLNPAKKPLILHISFENTIDQNIITLYNKLYELKNGKVVGDDQVDFDYCSKFIMDHFAVNGYYFQTLHYDPNSFSIFDLFGVLKDYIAAGYEIHMCLLDYLHLISQSTPGDRLDTKIQKTIDMVRNFCHPKGIAVANAHQLSTKAQDLAKTEKANFTKLVAGGGWYMDCQSLHTKLDLEFVMYIIKHIDGRKYLMFSRGKHRGGERTPEAKQHFMYRFEDVGGIVPDFGGECRAIHALPRVLDANAVEFVWE